MLQQMSIAQDQQSREPQPLSPGGPQFDAQTFRTNSLRFSPYLHQPFLPSQPWPETGKPSSHSAQYNSNIKGSTVFSARAAEGTPQERPARQISTGPDDQLFEELNDALNAEETNVPGASSQYLSGGNKITFDPRLGSDWNGMRQEPYQTMMQGYQQMSNPILQAPFSSNSSQNLPFHMNANNILPSSPAERPQSFYHPRPPPPQNGAHARSNIPGYYRSSLKLWSQQDANSQPRPEGDMGRSDWPG
jgi:hypothetical protein